MISLNHMADFYLLFMVQYYTGEWNYRQEAWCDIQDYISKSDHQHFPCILFFRN